MDLEREQIIDKAHALKYCTENLGECFEGELCPESHSTACCLHCAKFPHEGLGPATKKLIDTKGHCNNIRCFRAKAILLYDEPVPQPKRPKL